MSYPPPPAAPPYMPPSGQPQAYPAYPQQPPAYPPGYQQPAYTPTQGDFDGGNPTNNQFAASPFSDKTIRRRFVGKVYSILAVQLLVTAAIVAIFTLVAVFFATYIALACCGNVRRKFPGNFIALGVFTLALAYMAGTLSAMYTVSSVLVCLLITLGVCVSVSIAAICCPCDITKCQAVIAFLSILLFIFGIAVMITYFVAGYNQTLYAVYGGIAAVVFSIYLAFDTQMIMGGRKYELSPEEYIYGAMQLYCDVVNLFMIFLSLFGVSNASDAAIKSLVAKVTEGGGHCAPAQQPGLRAIPVVPQPIFTPLTHILP
ncbi:Fas apoptotic inhibitory molecule [Echinococcus granulosus]|uniref:Fas apoptotic inhibitory molecule n=1 Tax=Echinococcus granulosus TaxID=6210 RepID=W6UBD6_ECHGR|nr:Fas apoptotic inhibitory molecule [Echinococcus granulosus]EUB58688.1 Fas apoptotic inhibitory molecule [Echinococcus granulosus]